MKVRRFQHFIDFRMGFFATLFGRKAASGTESAPAFSPDIVNHVGALARQHADLVNESLRLAVESQDFETKYSRLALARQEVAESKELASRYPFLQLTSLDEVESSIDLLEQQFDLARVQATVEWFAEGNHRGKLLEAEGRIEDAVAEYENLVQYGADTPHPYRRLAILYRKAKSLPDERRVLETALQNVPGSNATHYEWFADRLAKLQQS